jgi:transcriptional regulator with XRE-family HTH domain
MIKNERQYRITKSQADKFEQALAQVAAATPDTAKLHPLLVKAQREALTSQLADLNRQLADYNSLRSGECRVLELTSFDDLPRALIQARIALGLSQKDLAERLGLKEQQLQRYEATDYASASLDRVKEIIKALGLTVREDVILPDVQITSAKLFKQLREAGFDRKFVLSKLIPKRLAAQLGNGSAKESESNIVLGAAASISRVLGCSIASLFGEAPLQFDKIATGTVRYKVAARANERRLNAYTLYAVYLALLTLEATSDLVQKPIPTDPTEFRTKVLSAYGSLSFETVLRYLWSLGVPVLPLKDPGTFHGACIREDGRNIIVLKQQTSSSARWLYDSLHESRHAGEKPNQKQYEVIESQEPSGARQSSDEEKTAGRFAGDVILAGRAEELAKKCVEAADGALERLKKAVPLVATREKVPVAALANYMAFRLSLQGENWWPTATNLQTSDEDPWQLARDIFLKSVNLGSLNETDRNLLQQAMSDH